MARHTIWRNVSIWRNASIAQRVKSSHDEWFKGQGLQLLPLLFIDLLTYKLATKNKTARAMNRLHGTSGWMTNPSTDSPQWSATLERDWQCTNIFTAKFMARHPMAGSS
jgi:hypothetical protein